MRHGVCRECHALLSNLLAFLFKACLESKFGFFVSNIKNCQDIVVIVKTIIIFIVSDTRHISYISPLSYFLLVVFVFLVSSFGNLA